MILGIDPGVSGGIALLNLDGKVEAVITVRNYTTQDIFTWFKEIKGPVEMVYLERVHSMPGQGVRSVFTFGQNYGAYLGLLAACRFPITHVTPGVWQRAMSCLSKGDKNVTKRRAQELFPGIKVTHATADALLIAAYGLCQRNRVNTDDL